MPSQPEIMSKITEGLRERHNSAVVSTWFDDATVASFDGHRLVLRTPVAFKRDFIENRFLGDICAILRSQFGDGCEAEIVLGGASAEGDGAEVKPEKAPPDYRDFVFDTFVVGESNKFAAAAAKTVAQSPGASYNPLFIYGGSGLGKTHLLFAIMNVVRENHPDYCIRLFSAEQFTNELVAALNPDNTAEFNEKYRQADLLLVDDIQFIARSDYSQESFFHTFDALYRQGKQIVLTSDRPPRDLLKLEERLITRFEMGLTVDINPPDFETRMAIIKAKAQRLGLQMQPDVAEHIAQTITANVRQLEGTVKKLMAYRDLLGSTIDIGTAQLAIGDLMRENPGLNPTPGMIISEVCSFYRVDEAALIGKSRQAKIVSARQTAMYLIRSMTSLSLEQIGDDVFFRDHTTVMHSVRKVDELRRQDASYDNDIKTMIENIRGS